MPKPVTKPKGTERYLLPGFVSSEPPKHYAWDVPGIGTLWYRSDRNTWDLYWDHDGEHHEIPAWDAHAILEGLTTAQSEAMCALNRVPSSG
jgi:hypothetical protein